MQPNKILSNRIHKTDTQINTRPISVATAKLLILELHIRMGHLNFSKIIEQFRDGLYDSDAEISTEFTAELLKQLQESKEIGMA